MTGSVTACADTISAGANSVVTSTAAGIAGLGAAKPIDIGKLKSSAEGLTESVATQAKRATVAPLAAAEFAGLGIKTSVNVAKRATVAPFAVAGLAGQGVKTSVNVLADSVASCADALKASVDVKDKSSEDVKEKPTNPKKFSFF